MHRLQHSTASGGLTCLPFGTPCGINAIGLIAASKSPGDRHRSLIRRVPFFPRDDVFAVLGKQRCILLPFLQGEWVGPVGERAARLAIGAEVLVGAPVERSQAHIVADA